MTDSHDDRTAQVPVSLPTRANHGFDFDEADTAHLTDVERALLIKDVEFWIAQSDTWKQLANVERAVSDRLRAVIKSAPHEYTCYAGKLAVAKCTCWKADAL